MKQTKQTEESAFDFESFFETENFAANPLATTAQAAALTRDEFASAANASSAQTALTAIKWAFLYFPGTVAIYFVVLGFALSMFYGDWFLELFLGAFGILAVATFMIMFGIGKLLDMKYLKVVLGVFTASTLAAILYSALTVLIPGDFFGLFFKLTFALPAVVGYFVKRNLDSDAKN